MSRLLQSYRVGALLSAALLLSGCGPKELSKQETYPTRGKLVRQGEPVRFAIVTFSTTQPPRHEATGVTGEDGSFALRTYSNTEADGAPAGEYKLTVEEYDAVKAGPLPANAKPSKVPPEARNPQQTFEVKEEETDLGNIELP